MEATSGIANTTRIEQESALTPDTSASTSSKSSSFDGAKFETFLKESLGGEEAGQVSEEALFASLLQQRVETLKGAEVGMSFSAMMDGKKAEMMKADGFVPLEDAATGALRELRASGLLTAEESDQVYSEAFQAAQLDDNTEVLYDDRGGAGDPTIAVSDYGTAMASAKGLLEQIHSGAVTVASRFLDGVSSAAGALTSGGISSIPMGGTSSATGGVVTPTGNTFDGENGFLFKPISENQGTLAVLLPEAYKGMVSGVTVMDPLGNVLDDGVSTGYGEEGTREKFSFSKKGEEYPSDLTVHVSFMDGTHTQYSIPDPSQRYD